MNTNTIETNVKASVKKSSNLNEITDKDFTIVDLVKINPDVSPFKVRSHVTKHINSGRYTLVGALKSGGRGKPSNLYRVKN